MDLACIQRPAAAQSSLSGVCGVHLQDGLTQGVHVDVQSICDILFNADDVRVRQPIVEGLRVQQQHLLAPGGQWAPQAGQVGCRGGRSGVAQCQDEAGTLQGTKECLCSRGISITSCQGCS